MNVRAIRYPSLTRAAAPVTALRIAVLALGSLLLAACATQPQPL
jgi:hypothetical protein